MTHQSITPHEREQTRKVIDRLEDEAELSDVHAKSSRDFIEKLNREISVLQERRKSVREWLEGYEKRSTDRRHAAEMLSAELEGEGDPRWRSSSPDAANAEAHARAAIEKLEVMKEAS